MQAKLAGLEIMTFKNSRKDSFLSSIPTATIDCDKDKLATKCKFNYSYMDFSQEAGQDFDDWSPVHLLMLSKKLVEFSRESLSHWAQRRAGGGKVLVVYPKFPENSDFIHPKSVPHQAQWARFRLEKKIRLIGFLVPEAYDGKKHGNNGFRFDCNTFYVVFLDRDHRFYK
jgi:hypothetical protein